jgi:hypothetical protein
VFTAESFEVVLANQPRLDAQRVVAVDVVVEYEKVTIYGRFFLCSGLIRNADLPADWCAPYPYGTHDVGVSVLCHRKQHNSSIAPHL